MHGHLTEAAPALASAGLWAAFLLGLTGGFGHCLAMCGPFVAATSLAEGEGRAVAAVGAEASPASRRSALPSPAAFQALYHAGSLTTYALLGLLLGLLGQAGALAGLGSAFSPELLTRWLKVAAGASLVVLGLVLLASALRRRGFRVPEPTALVANRAWFRRASASLTRRGPRWGFALGMLMGLLPCAPLLPVEIAALATGVPLYGALTMLAFGIGTVPALAGLGVASGLIGSRARGLVLDRDRGTRRDARRGRAVAGPRDRRGVVKRERRGDLRPVRTAGARQADARTRQGVLLRRLPPRLRHCRGGRGREPARLSRRPACSRR